MSDVELVRRTLEALVVSDAVTGKDVRLALEALARIEARLHP